MTQTTARLSADLTDLMNLTDYPWSPAPRVGASMVLPDEEYEIRVVEEDGTFYLTVLAGGRAQLIHTEARFSGVAAQAAVLATIDAVVAELL